MWRKDTDRGFVRRRKLALQRRPRRGGLTCSLWTLSLSSARTLSPSLHLDCSSCSCTSSFFFLCSTSCLAWLRTRSSPDRSAFSFSSACLFLSRLALA